MKKFFTSKWAMLLTIITLFAVAKLSGSSELLAAMAMPFVFGTVAGVPGSPDYTTSSTGSAKIPWLFSRKTIVKFYDESVMPFISQRDYEGG